jgi:hypothetical protein
MKRLLALFLCLGAAGVTACNGGRTSSSAGYTDSLNAQEVQPLRWDDFREKYPQTSEQDPAAFPLPVTVRTTPGKSVTVFGRRFETNGEQWWVHGRSGDREPTQPMEGVEQPFWTSEPARMEVFQRYERMLEAGETPGDIVPPELYFEVNGWAVGVKAWTQHEGILRRIHIDVPDNPKENEVTVIGYYSRSWATTALELPRTACKWCGDVQVCTADPQCP